MDVDKMFLRIPTFEEVTNEDGTKSLQKIEYNLDNLIDDSTEDNIENNTFASIVSVDSLPDEIKNNNPRERGKSVLKTVLEQLGISYENTKSKRRSL